MLAATLLAFAAVVSAGAAQAQDMADQTIIAPAAAPGPSPTFRFSASLGDNMVLQSVRPPPATPPCDLHHSTMQPPPLHQRPPPLQHAANPTTSDEPGD